MAKEKKVVEVVEKAIVDNTKAELQALLAKMDELKINRRSELENLIARCS